MDIKRLRIKIYVDVLGTIVNKRTLSREDAVNLLKKIFEELNLEPIRGASKPPDIYEKELISLYIIAKYGLNILGDYPELVKLFYKEILLEEAINTLMNDPPEIARSKIEKLLPYLDESTLSKILRFGFTLTYLDFKDKKFMINLIKNCYSVFPDKSDIIRRFTKFFIAASVADEILKGRIKDSLNKEIEKHALSAEIGIPKATPNDEYLAKVSLALYDIDVRNILRVKHKHVKKPKNG